MDTGYPAMIPELQSPKKDSQATEEVGILVQKGGQDGEDLPDSTPPCIPLNG